MKPKTKYFMSKIMAMNKKIYSILAIILVFTLLLPQSAFAYSPTYGWDKNSGTYSNPDDSRQPYKSSVKPKYVLTESYVKNTFSEQLWNDMVSYNNNDEHQGDIYLIDTTYVDTGLTYNTTDEAHYYNYDRVLDYANVKMVGNNDNSFISKWSAKSKTTSDGKNINVNEGYIATCQDQDNDPISEDMNDKGNTWHAVCKVTTTSTAKIWTWTVHCTFHNDDDERDRNLQSCSFVIEYSVDLYSRGIKKSANTTGTKLCASFPDLYSLASAEYYFVPKNKYNSSNPTANHIAKFVTDSDGNGVLTYVKSPYTNSSNKVGNIGKGEQFYLVEGSASKGFVSGGTVGPVVISGDSTGIWYSSTTFNNGNNRISNLSETPYTVYLSVEKLLGGSVSSELDGAEFSLYYRPDGKPSISSQQTGSAYVRAYMPSQNTKQVCGFKVQNGVTRENGALGNISYTSVDYPFSVSNDGTTVMDIPYGYYTLVETRVPTNHKYDFAARQTVYIGPTQPINLPDDVQYIGPESNNAIINYTFTVEEPEKPHKSHSVIKNGTGIDNIDYVIVELQDTDGNIITEDYIGNDINNPIKLTKDGAFTIDDNELSKTAWSYEWTHLKDNLEYKVVETAVKPINGEENTEISKIYITDSVTENNTTTITNDNGSVSLGIKKEKDNTSIDVGPITGAEYTLLYNSNGNPSISNRTRSKNQDGSWTLNYTLDSNTIEVATFVIDNDGIGKIKGTNNTIYNGLPGKYMFVETKVPKNYAFDTNIETIYTLNNGDSLTNNDIVSIELVHTEPLQLSLEKTSDSSKPMTGAEFTIQFYEGAQSLDDIKNKNSDKTLVYTINLNNTVNFKVDNPIGGIMYDNKQFPIGLGIITETKAPDGYEVSTSWIYNDVNYYIPNTGVVFSIRENSTNTEAYSYLWNGAEWILSSNISSNLNVEEPSETGKFYFTKYLDGTTKILPNTEFKLYFSINEPSLSNYSSLTSKIITTDSNGNYQSDNLETGWYILEEIRCDANKGMNLVSPIKFEIKKGDNIDLNQKADIINYQPIISTQEWDGELSASDYKTHMSNPDNDVKIVDRVTYSNLEPNKVYTVKAIIMDITGGTARWLRTSDRKLIQAQKSFTANSDYVDVNFASFSTENMYIGTSTKLTTLEGRKFVIYEFLFEGNQEGILLTTTTVNNLLNNTGNVANAVRTVDGYVKHADMGDVNQIGYFPEIHTLESDTKTLNHVSVLNLDANNKEWITVKDVLTYSGLDTNLTYTIKVQVREKSTDTVIAEDTSHSFKPTDSNGTYTINDITFEAIYGPNNKPVDSFYITEELYVGAISDNKLAASHTLPIDDQSGKVARIKTIVNTNVNTGERDNGILLAYASTNVTINDRLQYSNLNNETYTIECVYKYVGGDKDGQIVKDATGNELRIRRENIQLSDGSINMRLIRKDLSNLEGEEIMAYETIYWTNSNNQTIIVAQEANFDVNQTVRFIGIPESPYFKVVKMDQFGNYIAGATLEIRDESGTRIGDPIISKTTATEVSLNPGKYTLVETKSPANYALNESISFEVKDDNKLYINDEVVDTAMITMVDYNLTALPTAGGIGTIWFIISGLILMLCAVFLKKKYV